MRPCRLLPAALCTQLLCQLAFEKGLYIYALDFEGSMQLLPHYRLSAIWRDGLAAWNIPPCASYSSICPPGIGF